MKWLKDNTGWVTNIIAILGAMTWMNGKFNALEKDIAIIKTVLVMKDILPKELATQEQP